MRSRAICLQQGLQSVMDFSNRASTRPSCQKLECRRSVGRPGFTGSNLSPRIPISLVSLPGLRIPFCEHVPVVQADALTNGNDVGRSIAQASRAPDDAAIASGKLSQPFLNRQQTQQGHKGTQGPQAEQISSNSPGLKGSNQSWHSPRAPYFHFLNTCPSCQRTFDNLECRRSVARPSLKGSNPSRLSPRDLHALRASGRVDKLECRRSVGRPALNPERMPVVHADPLTKWNAVDRAGVQASRAPICLGFPQAPYSIL